MPQSDNHLEVNADIPDEVDAALDAALEKAGVDVGRKAVQDAAAAEERHAAELIAQSRAQQEEPARQPQPLEEESLVSVAAQGREYLLKRMREHAAEAEAKKNAYVPPPLTERQRQNLAEEQAAGQRARARHEAELANRPPPPAKEVWDGTSTPVFRPGGSVPDPVKDGFAGGFVAGSRQYGADT